MKTWKYCFSVIFPSFVFQLLYAPPKHIVRCYTCACRRTSFYAPFFFFSIIILLCCLLLLFLPYVFFLLFGYTLVTYLFLISFLTLWCSHGFPLLSCAVGPVAASIHCIANHYPLSRALIMLFSLFYFTERNRIVGDIVEGKTT